jgi:CHAT domain-containing protein/tetratricopeptide (TPR) repeat protein
MEQMATRKRTQAASALAHQHYERATSLLSEAVAFAPQACAAWNDLAALHLRRSVVARDGYETFLALAASEHAIACAPASATARYNHALALESLGLAEQATSEWRALQEYETSVSWRQEEARRIAVTRAAPLRWEEVRTRTKAAVIRGDTQGVRELVSKLPQRFREEVEEKILVDWAHAEESGDVTEASWLLARGRSIAAALVAVNGERLPADATAAIDREMAAQGDGRKAVVRAVAAYGSGLARMDRTDFSGAIKDLRKARELLTRQHNPLALRAVCQIAYCHYQRSEYAKAEQLLSPLSRLAQQLGYRALHGRALWILGVSVGIRGRLSESLAFYNLAFQDFRQLREATNLARVSSILAEVLDLLGRRPEAWRVIAPALLIVPNVDQPVHLAAFYQMAAFVALEAGEAGAASRLQEEALRWARLSSNADEMTTILRSQAVAAARLGRREEALAKLNEARLSLSAIRDPENRRTIEGDICLAQGELTRPVSPRAAVAQLDSAIDIFRSTSYHYLLQRALFERALCNAALGRRAAQGRDLSAAIVELERQRGAIFPIEERSAYLDKTRSLFEAMISLQVAERHYLTAFKYTEMARSRALLDWILVEPPGAAAPPAGIERAAPVPLSLNALLRELPERTVLIEYSSLPGHLSAYIMRRHHVEIAISDTPASTLRELVSELDRSLRDFDSDRATRAVTTLYDLLLRPLTPYVRPGDNLVFIPDGSLNVLPFAALRDRQTGRYLMQDHASSVAPSAAVYLANLRRDRGLVGLGRERALVVVDPEFDHDLFPALKRLPGAAAEKEIAAEFPGSEILRGRTATKRAFLKEAPLFQIVHFGGHSVVNLERPLQSQMLFSRDDNDPAHGVLLSGEILGRKLSNTRLVVLASCATGVGRTSDTEGVESIARPFLAAGVPVVLASLWNVDDDMTARFMTHFYHYLRLNLDVVAAVRSTQLELLEHGDGVALSPMSWAAFEAIGASAPPRLPH